MTITNGTAYVAPAGYRMELTEDNTIVLQDVMPYDRYRPSADCLLASIARTCGPRSVGIILTGMGDDGAYGIHRIKEAGGSTIAQDESTSAVSGMPGTAMREGHIDVIRPIHEIGRSLADRLKA